MLEILLKSHRDQNEIQHDDLWENGIFVFDTNVILDLYRLPETASNDLINALNHPKINNRIWIAFQVIVEFLNNRIEIISDQKSKFTEVKKHLEQAITDYDTVFSSLNENLNKLQLRKKHSLINPDEFLKENSIISGKNVLADFLEALPGLEKKQSDIHQIDKIKDRVLEIFKNKIGKGFEQKKLDEICKNGDARYEKNIPPGYKDKNKKGFYLVEKLEIVKKFGDLLLWNEIIEKAKSEKIPNLIFVTGDVKEDWWFEKSGKKIGPRRELLNEIYTAAPTLENFYMYDTAGFLKHAQKYLKADIQDLTITQTENLINSNRKKRSLDDSDPYSLIDIISSAADFTSGTDVHIAYPISSLPAVKINKRHLFICLSEIISNKIEHGTGKKLTIEAKLLNEDCILVFRNQYNSFNHNKNSELRSSNISHRGAGIKMITSMMMQEGVGVSTFCTDEEFVLEMNIPHHKFVHAPSIEDFQLQSI